jgi:hypothetical protein
MTLYRFRATWTVDTGPDPAGDFKLLPIAPKRLRGALTELLAKLLEVAGETGVRVGAVSVTCQQEPTETTSITCPVCRMTSYNPTDIAQGYCGNCHDYTGAPR